MFNPVNINDIFSVGQYKKKSALHIYYGAAIFSNYFYGKCVAREYYLSQNYLEKYARRKYYFKIWYK